MFAVFSRNNLYFSFFCSTFAGDFEIGFLRIVQQSAAKLQKNIEINKFFYHSVQILHKIWHLIAL